jgi:conjugal transfer pilus assembly protein TraA
MKRSLVLLSLIPLLLVGPEALAISTTTPDGVTVINADGPFLELLGFSVGLATGALGKALAIIVFIVGLITGVARGSAMGFLVGALFAVCLAFGPSLLIKIFSATLPAADFAHTALACVPGSLPA